MKTLKSTIAAMSILTVASLSIIACSNSDERIKGMDILEKEHISQYATMQLEGRITPFDATRSTTATWNEGDIIYLQFSVGSDVVNGTAIYDGTVQEWNVQYNGTLTNGVETKCEAFYFENTDEASRTSVFLNEHSVIYMDKSASYLFEDGKLIVTAYLHPMTGRIRFKGEGAEKFRFSGLSYYNGYDITSNSFTTTELNLHSGQTNTDGYSDYYYGFFADESNKEICFDDYVNCVSYTRSLGEQALALGRSGYLNIPTIDNFNGWNLFTFKDFTVSNVKFRMIRVITESSYYYVGETEVTQELWKAIMGTNPSTFTGTNMPVETISYSDYTAFISKLNAKTGKNFYIPSSTEWTFAAKGAGVSKSYTYSGSNNADEVAWHNGNANNTTHPVKTKLPNEIGIYDMSGNVSEWVSGSSSYYYGGDWYNELPVGYSGYYTGHGASARSYLGIRLFLKD